MMLVAAIGSSDESNERVLELAARVVELDEVELGVDDGAADLGAAVLGRRQREQETAALLVRIGDALHAVDRLEHLPDAALRIIAGRWAHRDGDLADLALGRGELALAAGAEQLALAEHEEPITGLADLGQDVTRD